jgi:hypothetical protein
MAQDDAVGLFLPLEGDESGRRGSLMPSRRAAATEPGS